MIELNDLVTISKMICSIILTKIILIIEFDHTLVNLVNSAFIHFNLLIMR